MSLRGLVWVNCTWGVWLCLPQAVMGGQGAKPRSLPWLPKGGIIIHQRFSLYIRDQAKTCRIIFWNAWLSFLKRDSLWEPCQCPYQGISRRILNISNGSFHWISTKKNENWKYPSRIFMKIGTPQHTYKKIMCTNF